MAAGDVIKDLVDGADDKIEGVESSILSVEAEISTLQEKQDAFVETLEQIESEISDYLDNTSIGDWKFNHSDYYTGGLQSYEANVSDWQKFDLLIDSGITFDSIDAIEVSSTTGISTGMRLYFRSTSSNTYPIPNGIVDNIDGNLIEMTMETNHEIPTDVDAIMELVYEKDGTGWDNDADIISWVDEFDFTNNFIWEPLGTEGTYGTKDKIEKMQTATTVLESDKQKLIDAKTKLARFSS